VFIDPWHNDPMVGFMGFGGQLLGRIWSTFGTRLITPAMISTTTTSATTATPTAHISRVDRLLLGGSDWSRHLGDDHRFGNSFRVAQEPENAWLDPNEWGTRRLLHSASELGLHGDLRGAPHEGQELSLRGFFGQLLVVQGLPLAFENLKRCF
jgi:hypothetical protein